MAEMAEMGRLWREKKEKIWRVPSTISEKQYFLLFGDFEPDSRVEFIVFGPVGLCCKCRMVSCERGSLGQFFL